MWRPKVWNHWSRHKQEDRKEVGKTVTLTTLHRCMEGACPFLSDRCGRLFLLRQWSPTLGLQLFLDFNSQKSWPAEVMVKASGSWSPITSGGPRLGTTVLRDIFCWRSHMMVVNGKNIISPSLSYSFTHFLTHLYIIHVSSCLTTAQAEQMTLTKSLTGFWRDLLKFRQKAISSVLQLLEYKLSAV